MSSQTAIIIGGIISVAGSLYYLMEVIRGKIKPNKVSFLLWSIAPLIAFAAQIQQGVGIEALITFLVGVSPIFIFIASFFNRKAEWKITTFDLICGALSIFGLALWLVTKTGNIAIAFSIAADALAAVPTIIKAYKYPDTEIAWPWLTPIVGVVITLLTLKELTFANSGFIIYIAIVNVIIFTTIQFRIGEKLGYKDKTSK